jgi:hypothetical protein
MLMSVVYLSKSNRYHPPGNDIVQSRFALPNQHMHVDGCPGPKWIDKYSNTDTGAKTVSIHSRPWKEKKKKGPDCDCSGVAFSPLCRPVRLSVTEVMPIVHARGLQRYSGWVHDMI